MNKAQIECIFTILKDDLTKIMTGGSIDPKLIQTLSTPTTNASSKNASSVVKIAGINTTGQVL